MLKVPCYDADGKKVKDLEIDESIFGERVLVRTLHQVIKQYEANKRVGTASTKTRAQVSGHKTKPYRQKGTGRARVGDRRSPLWYHGGVIFGPKPRNFRQEIPRQMKVVALNSALLSKFKDNEVIVVDGLKLDAPKTKTVYSLFKSLGLAEKMVKYEAMVPVRNDDGNRTGKKVSEERERRRSYSVLLGTAAHEPNLYLSARNIERCRVLELRNFNAYDVVRQQRLVLTREAFDALIASRSEDED